MGRINGRAVASLFPASGPVRGILLGEAPGPRGADQSGTPFWGDRAGIALYRALEKAGLADVPAAAWDDWDGARLRQHGLVPTLRRIALGNAFPSCPSDDSHSFRAPTNRELLGAANLTRLRADFGRALATLGGESLQVIALGKRALVLQAEFADLRLVWHPLPHPSAQGLLQAAPNRGKGLQIADLRAAWEERLETLLRTL